MRPDPQAARNASPWGRRSPWPLRRVWAMALVTLRHGLRMRLWLLVPLALVVLVLADVTSPRFDVAFEGAAAASSLSVLVLAVLAVIVGVFFAPYAFPAEIENKVAHSLVTKPVSRAEIVAGKAVGMSLLLLVILGAVGAGAYGYLRVRASSIQSLASARLPEARARAAQPADVNALESVAQGGPLQTYRYLLAEAGPDIGVAADASMPEAPGHGWVLGETGMQLVWRLDRTPLREWSAAGPCRLRIALAVHRPPGAGDEPVTVEAAFSPSEAWLRGLPSDAPPPVLRGRYEATAGGEVEVTVARADAPARKDVLAVPPEGDLVFACLAVQSGLVVAAGPGSLRIVGPGGQEFRVPEAPQVEATRERRRRMIVGRSQVPRQVAVFRFANVPPDVLGAGDVPLEATFSIDAFGPALVLTTAEVELVRPDTGARRTIRFSPENRRPTLLPVDPAFWRGGPLDVRLQCLTDEDFLGLSPESIRLRLAGGPFAWHFAKGVLHVWFFGTVLAGLGVMLSVRLSWYVGLLGTATLFLVGLMRDFLLQTPWMPFAWVARWLMARTVDVLGPQAARWVAGHVALPMPDLTSLLPPASFHAGEVIPAAAVLEGLGWTAAGLAVAVGAGLLLLRRREVAA